MPLKYLLEEQERIIIEELGKKAETYQRDNRSISIRDKHTFREMKLQI